MTIQSFQIQDDPLANKITANKLLTYFKNTKIQVQEIRPTDYGQDKIGHTGFFSRKFKNSLWQNVMLEMEMV